MGNEQKHKKSYEYRSFLLREAYIKWRRKVQESLSKDEVYSLLSQYCILGVIILLSKQKNKIIQKDIIEFTGLNKSIVSQTITKLIQEEYIMYKLRSNNLVLTTKLQSPLTLSSKMMVLLEHTCFKDHISAKGRRILNKKLNRIIKLTEPL
jgi:DNA-binding MarR family transcriptional regulator